jgi:hypothetical protein
VAGVTVYSKRFWLMTALALLKSPDLTILSNFSGPGASVAQEVRVAKAIYF